MPYAYLGLDGCRKGWAAAVYRKGSGFEALRLIDDLRGLKSERSRYRRIFMDIPMGFPADGTEERDCDRAARALLAKRKTSVFRVPVRAALKAADYREACWLNSRRAGMKISIQTWNLFPKMREADELLLRYPCLRKQVFESHPEVCFAALNSGREMKQPKKTAAGRRERLKVLCRYSRQAAKVLKQGLESFKRSEATEDDLLDAMVLAVSASLRLDQVPRRRVYDAKKIPMRIVFPRQHE